MLRPAEQILAFAMGAGFTRNTAADAAAIALVATGGDDAFEWHPTPGVWMVGLWGLDLYEHPALTRGEHLDPRRQAAYVRERWLAEGRSFAWHPFWDRVDRRRWSRVLRDPAVTPDPLPPSADAFSHPALGTSVRALGQATRDAIRAVGDALRWGGRSPLS